MDESDDTTVTEDADFSLILKGVEVEFASYTYARDDWWLELVVVVAELDEEGDTVFGLAVVMVVAVVTVDVVVVVELTNSMWVKGIQHGQTNFTLMRCFGVVW